MARKRTTSKKPTQKDRDQAKEMYLQGMSKSEISDLTGLSRTTLVKWSEEDKWDEQKAAAEVLNRKLLAKASELSKLTPQVKEEMTHEEAQDCLLLTLTSLKELLLQDPVKSVMLTKQLQSTIGSLEKLVSAKVKAKTEGKKQVDVQVQKVDWTEVMRMVIEAKRRGEDITKEEAFKALKAAQEKVNGT